MSDTSQNSSTIYIIIGIICVLLISSILIGVFFYLNSQTTTTTLTPIPIQTPVPISIQTPIPVSTQAPVNNIPNLVGDYLLTNITTSNTIDNRNEPVINSYGINGGPNQKWNFTPINGNDYSLVQICNKKTGNCLENGGDYSPNNTVKGFALNNSPDKLWNIKYDSITNSYSICNKLTNNCLENLNKNDNNLYANKSNNLNTQKWGINRV